jgi:hypothetical protein
MKHARAAALVLLLGECREADRLRSESCRICCGEGAPSRGRGKGERAVWPPLGVCSTKARARRLSSTPLASFRSDRSWFRAGEFINGGVLGNCRCCDADAADAAALTPRKKPTP